MKPCSEKLVGILGGMGPEATVYFFNKIVQLTPARNDQDHIRLIILNDPKIPDRTEAVLGEGELPVSAVQAGIDQLVGSGAEIIVIPCVSVHFFTDQITIPSTVTFLNILQEASRNTIRKWPHIRKVGILGTDLTISRKLFDPFFIDKGVSVLTLDGELQNRLVMKAICAIKGGSYQTPQRLLKEAANRLKDKGAEIIIAGCTEIPLVLNSQVLEMPFVDSLACLAESVVRHVKSIEVYDIKRDRCTFCC